LSIEFFHNNFNFLIKRELGTSIKDVRVATIEGADLMKAFIDYRNT